MFTEHRVAPKSPATGRRFRWLLYGTITVVALLMVGLTGANLAQSPRLNSAQINLTTSVERTGQRLLMQTNEPLAAVSTEQLAVTPPARATATASGSSLQIQFTDTLSYNTTYTVAVRDVTSINGTAPTTLIYSFTTPDPTLYYLLPAVGSGTDETDQIMSAPLSGGTPVSVYSAPHIRRFIKAPTAFIVDTINNDQTDALTIISLTGAAPMPVQIAGAGTVTSLKESAGSSLFGYTFNPAPSPLYPTVTDQLYAYDLTRGQDFTIPITGTDHEQLTTTDWAFVPGTTSLVARTSSNTINLIDILGEREGTSVAADIGQADALNGFIPQTKNLLYRAGGALFSIDLSKPNQSSTLFALAAPPTPGENVTVLDGAGTYLTVPDPAGSPTSATAAMVTAAGGRPIFIAPAGTPGLARVCSSPNGKYAALVTTATAPASSTNPPPPTITYLDLGTGQTLSTITGTQPDWCT